MKNVPIYGVRLILLSFLLGFINFIITKGDKHTLTPLIMLTGVLFSLGMGILGLGLFFQSFEKGKWTSKTVVFLGMILCGIGFLVVFINGPILNQDLNTPQTIFAGVVFMVGVLVSLVGAIISNLKK
ncbi:MAG: hypothetical protein RL094_742 [Candidatus Parcubacteria bacterium]|jgi:drug/metabolite transporter (DMT)-like permease